MASTLKAMHLLPLLVLLILVHSSNGAVPIVSLGQTLDMAQTNYLEYRKGFLAALNETSFNLIFRAVEVVTTFRVPVLDDSGSTSLAQANIDSLIDTYNASYILGQSGSDDSIEVGAARATSASIPYFAPFSGNPALSTPYNQYIVNLRPSYTDEIVGLIHHLTYTLEIARVSILYENTARSWTIASFAYTTLASIGLQVESNATFDPITWSDTSLNSAVQSLSSGYPGAIIMIGAHQPLSRFVVLARSVWRSIVYATISKASTEEFVNGITGSKDNIIVSQVVPPPSAVNFPWVQTYQQGIQKSGYPRQYTFASAEGYLAGKLLYSVMFNAYINSQSFMEALQQPNLQIRVGSANVNVGPYTSSCNQGLKNVYITKPSTDSTFALLDTFSYSTCAADTTLLMKPILFGQSAGLTGPLSTVVARYQVGIKAGIAQYNNDIGQVQYFNPPSTTSSAHLRQKISLSFLDDGGDATRTINNTQRLISQGVFGLIGSAGVDNTLASASEAAAAKVPLIGSFSGALGLRFPYNRYGINARASELDEAVAIIDLLVNKLELTKISLYYNERTFKQSGGYQALVDTLVSYEMALVSETTTTDTQAVTTLLKGDPEAVIMYASESELRDFSFYAIDSALKTAKFVVYSAVGSSAWSTQAWAHFTSAAFYQSMVFPPLDYGNPVTQAYLTALPAGETPDIASLEGYIAAQLVAAMLRGYQSPALAKETFLDVAYPSVLSIGSGGLGLGPYSVACNQGSRQVWIGDASKGNTYVSDIKFTGCGSQLTFNNVSAIIPPPPTSYANAVVGVAVGVAVPVGVIFIILGVYFTKKCHHKAKEYKDEDILFVLPDKINSSFADPARGEFPLELSVTELDFGGSEQPDIETWISDQFTIRNVLVNKPYKFTFYTPPKSEKYTMSVFPRKGKLRPGERMDVRVDIMFHCTTRLTCKLMMEAKGLSAEDSAVHCFLSIDKGSALSTKLDFDEIKMNGPPIGDGSFGTVYRGTWRGQDVAVKMLKVQADLSETQLFDLLREVNIMNKLRNPNIVSFTGAVTTPGKMCLVTEFVPLGNLTKYLKDGILSYAQKLKIASDAANGMNFLHRAGILHRDLKPDNLLVVSLNVNAPIMIKLSDFGSSRSINEEMARNYTAGIGTPIYMAPEILTKEAYSVKADVYSFAILLYELYNEKEPYQDFAHSWDVAKFVTEGGRPPKIEGCPEDYWKIIEKCWAHDPLARPTFEEIFVDFQKLFDELPEESILASLAQTFDTLRKSTYGLTASGSLRNNKVRSMSKSEGFRLVVEKIDEGSGMKTKSVGREEERERRRKHRKRKSRRMKSLNSATAAELMELPPVVPQASEAKIDITSESTFAAPSSRLPVSRVDTKNNFLKHDSSAHIKRQDSTLNNPGHRKFSFGVSNEV